MAKFLNTSGITYHLEELIKNAMDKLIIISPYLKFNERIKELIEDKNRMKIDVRIVYGKAELQPSEINWLRSLTYVRTSFCKNLHAKCYMNESECIITSLNLYDFSQVNNNEMGVYIVRDKDSELFNDASSESARIIRISEEVRISAEISLEKNENNIGAVEPEPDKEEKLTTSRLAAKMGIPSKDLLSKAVDKGYLRTVPQGHQVTDEGKTAGITFHKGAHGWYFIFPNNISL
ncbi:MAG: phospholipase D family protein [Streptococcus parasanguinis]|uniref:phospholipase D family protein n=1 Tax=Leclercia adecarboxylata TaxID=83655 RepID=UPI0009810F38|nr:phospholipase D family protein [Leclercia adecarboxylata]MDU1983668.1 phospholipase D family protein [Streptococcus parasanguinis]OOB84447.1 DNA repair protein [Leclercia adecarboxylata]